MKIVAVTACPSGVAHTYMAAKKLQQAAEKYGVTIDIETQGQVGSENELTKQQIADADVVILTKDIGIKGEERFNGKPIVRVMTDDCIGKAGSIIKTLQKKFN
jgi:fructose-specific PTS system IIB-like component